MKKLCAWLLAALLLLAIFTFTALATDNGADAAADAADAAARAAEEAKEAVAPGEATADAAVLPPVAADPEPEPKPTPGEPMTWEYLATIIGATAGTLLIVEFLKVPIDKVWKIPTRAFVYLVALVILLLATYFTKGLTVDTAILTAVNAFVVAVAAYGSYELTFKKLEANRA